MNPPPDLADLVPDLAFCGACGAGLATSETYTCPGCRRVDVPGGLVVKDLSERALARLLRDDAKAAIGKAAEQTGKTGDLPPLTAEGLVAHWETLRIHRKYALFALLFDRVEIDPGEPGTYDPEQTRVVWARS